MKYILIALMLVTTNLYAADYPDVYEMQRRFNEQEDARREAISRRVELEQAQIDRDTRALQRELRDKMNDYYRDVQRGY